MANKLTKVFDNIGFNFQTTDDKIIPVKPLSGFNTIQQNHVGYYIPYLCRNKKLGLLEIGIGDVRNNDIGQVIIVKHKIVVSSNNNDAVNFGNDNNNEFFIFANQNVFNTSISNVVVLDSDSVVDNVSAVYLADCSEKSLYVTLPEVSKSDNLIIEFKNISPANNLVIRDNRGGSIAVLDDVKNHIRLAAANDSWISLENNIDNTISTLSEPTLSAQNSPDGNNFSFQYKEGNDFSGSSIYWDAVNNQLLLGADNSTDAHSVIPTSGNQPLYINQKKLNSDFIVYGSGNRNLFFSYDGRLGLNIPSGSRPSTIFHVVNTICQEGFRLENRNACHPANITLYHKPANAIVNGSTVSQINLAGKNNDGNRVDYGVIEASAVNTSSTSPEGGVQLKIAAVGTGIKVFDSNYSSTTVGYSGNSLTINRTGSTTLQNNAASVALNANNNIIVSGSTVGVYGSNIVLGAGGASVSVPGAVSVGTVSATSIQSNTITIPNIGSGSFLTVDGNNRLVGSTRMSVNALGTLNLPIAPDKLLQTTTNGSITGIYSTDDYFRTDGDIVWNKYTHRLASACLRQITFANPVSVEEYSVGDQLAVVSSSSTVYRRIVGVDIDNNLITGLLVDQNISLTDIDNLTVYSVTKGGYLSIQMSTEDGVISDSTQTIISARAGAPTVFNTLQKDIDFSVYGIDSTPALKVKANSGKISIISGLYRPFSPKHELPAFPIVVTTGGAGISNLYSSANYNYSNTQNLFSGIVSDVGSNGLPSHYGTYDQNGNASEWIEKPGMLESRDKEEFVAGGSYNTSNTIGGSGLKHVELLTRASGYNYVGFRVAGLYNTTDPTTISAADQLNMSFVGIIDPQNSEDSTTTYIRSNVNNNEQFSSIVINNLGVVDKMYRIGRYEVTNQQYCRFLNAVAKSNDRGLYDSRMSSTNVGGITRIYDEEYIYSVKPNMNNKPVLFVSYLSAIRFINWLHNGASITLNEQDIDYTLDLGAYTIIPIGTDSYNVVKSSYRKYWLPDLNEWHKAAYFEPVDVNSYTGTSTVMVKRDDPYLVASGVDSETNKFKELFANLSVSGWLYVDHLIVGDGTIRSSRRFTGISAPSNTTNNNTTQGSVTNQTNNPNPNLPPTSLDDIISNDNNAVDTTASTVSVGTSISGIPLRRAEDTECNENPPWFCDPNNTGPSLF